MTPIASAPAAMDKKQILALCQQHLKSVFSEHLDRQIEVDRFHQVANALRNELFWRGKQHIALGFDEGDGSATWKSVIPDSDLKDNQQALAYTINITRSDGQKFISVVGTRAPHAKVSAIKPEDVDMVRKARRADAALRTLQEQWGADARQKDIARIQWKTGPAFLHTHYVADGDLYGWVEEPVYEQQPQEISPAGFVCPACLGKTPAPHCDNCNIPLGDPNFEEAKTAMVDKMVDTKRYPNGAVHLDVLNVLEVVIQRHAKDLKGTDYLRWEREVSKARIYSLYREELGPDWLKKDDGSTSNQAGDSAAEQARQQLINTDATYRADPASSNSRVTDDFLRPAVYALIDHQPLRDVLTEQFPRGLHITKVGEKYVDVIDCLLDEEWAVAKTGTDEMVFSDALCNDIVPLNEVLNKFYNMAIQIVLQSIPKTIVDSSLLTKAAATRPILGEIIPTKMASGQDLSKMMAMLPTARFSDQLVPLMQMLRADSRELDGVLEAIFGGGPTTQTWREAEQRKNQALQQLSTAFVEIVAAWKAAYTNGLRLLAAHGIGSVDAPPKKSMFASSGESIDMEMLDIEGIRVDVNEAIPMSMPEEREQLMYALSTFDPETRAALGLLHPASVPRLHQLLNLEGIYCPGAKERAKVINIIRRLKDEPPVQTIDPMTGQPITQPAIMPDPVLDDHALMYELTKAYLNDEDEGLVLEIENPQAFQHIRLYAEAQQRAANPPMPVNPDGTPMQQPAGGPGEPPPPNVSPMERQAA
jgi:hypothetical protein